jgi:transposase InsO family protein
VVGNVTAKYQRKTVPFPFLCGETKRCRRSCVVDPRKRASIILIRPSSIIATALTRPEIFNNDQGSQFTSREYTGRLEDAGIAVSRDGRGRASDNVFVERLWRSVKYKDIYIKEYDRVPDLESGLTTYFQFYDEEHPHQSLDYQTPGEVYRGEVRGG